MNKILKSPQYSSHSVPSYREAELIKENKELKAKPSNRCYYFRSYEGDRPNLNWPAFFKRIKQPVFPRIQSTVTPNGKGYEL